MSSNKVKSPYIGSGSITREQFLFYEMRITARLLEEGLEDSAIYSRVLNDNLFQYPTERMIKVMVRTCLARLRSMNDPELISAIANQPSDVAKQVCLFAMMSQYRLIWDFMITVIGEKYRQQDFSFSRRDINSFIMRLQEQDDVVAGWSDTTVKKIISVISRILIENEYIENSKARVLNRVMINPILENAIRAAGYEIALPAFNCFN